jgi:hypothetical protein
LEGIPWKIQWIDGTIFARVVLEKDSLNLDTQKSMIYRSKCLLPSRVRRVTFSQAARAMLNLPCLTNTHCKQLYFTQESWVTNSLSISI